jgi:2-methylcitrate dehydratase PrpD
MRKDAGSGGVIREVSSYISRGREATLPAEVIREAKNHILDTLAAMVSGSQFKPGELARRFARKQAGVEEAQVIGSEIVTSAINAALVNGMMAHADETDDSHEKSLTHPGCAVVPAALAASEREGASGMTFLKGVVAGYDIGCRLTQALGVHELNSRFRCTHSIGGTFGAASASAVVLGLDEGQVGQVLSYAAQQASGVIYYSRDPEHVEKAFVFGGMPARNGATAAIFVREGFTGVSDPFTGENNFLEAFSPNSVPEKLCEGLGSHYEILITNIKKFSVGSPIQAPLQALLLLMDKHGFKSGDVESIVVRMPESAAGRASRAVVNNRDMPNINLQYILAAALLDGDLSFKAAHDFERMNDPAILEIKQRITTEGDPGMDTSKTVRQGIVEVVTKEGKRFREHVIGVRGTAENPMTPGEVEKKCLDLLIPVLGGDRARKLVDRIWNIEQVRDVRELRPLLSLPF